MLCFYKNIYIYIYILVYVYIYRGLHISFRPGASKTQDRPCCLAVRHNYIFMLLALKHIL
jgi:hypothetical protein